MSEITIIFVEGNEISFLKAHYRKVMEMVNNNFKQIKGLETRKKLDAGYLLVDLDKKLMLDCQSGFSIEHLNPDVKVNIIKNWYYLNHPNW